jgi:oligosaccharyltransferase complex subunit gamma
MIYRGFISLIAVFSFISIVYSDSFNAQALTKKSLESPNFIIPITQSDLSGLAEERDYYTLLVLTSTDPKNGCGTCENLDRVIRRVAESWFADYSLSNFLFFVNIDLADKSNANLFNYLGINTIPHIWLIPSSKSTSNINYKDDNGYGILSEPHLIFKLPMTGIEKQVKELTKFISLTLHKTIRVKQEQPFEKFVLAFGLTFSLILIIKKRGPKIVTNLTKKNIYKALVIIAIIAFTCGYNFTVMEKVPLIAKDDNNNIVYINGLFQYQFGIEVIIIGLNYLGLASSLINLIYLGHYKVNSTSTIPSEHTKSLCIFINILIIYVLSSCLTSAFIRKEPYYPYHFSRLF